MRIISFTDFRKKASDLITEAERGETIILLCRRKPVAENSPYVDEVPRIPSWKKSGIRLETKGIDLSFAILEEREGGP